MKDTGWKNIFSIPVSDKDMYKEYSKFLQLNELKQSKKKIGKKSHKFTKDHILYDTIYMKHPSKSIEIECKCVVVRGWEGGESGSDC